DAERAYRKAIDIRQKLVAEFPDVAGHWAALGQLNLELEMWGKMATNYSKAIEIEPQNSWYWHERGYANMRLEKWEEVIRDYSKAISLDPSDWGSWQRRGEAYAHSKQWDKAKQDYIKSIELLELADSPSILAGVLVEFGHMLRESGQLQEAEEAYRKAEEMEK
ncbi:MAG: tetratricopeptide repeat protein, partial [Planctomycetota bacterium]